MAADPNIGYVAAKNSSTVRHDINSGISYQLYVDNRGARVNTPAEQTPGKVDILAIGGSYTWGHGVNNENTFPQILSRDLGMSIANFAMGSYGTVQSLQLLERHIGLRPKVVVYGFMDDHLRRNISPCAPSYAPYCLGVSHIAFDDQKRPFRSPPPTEYSAAFSLEYYQSVAGIKAFQFNDIFWGTYELVSNIHRKFFINSKDDMNLRELAITDLMRRMSNETKRIGAQLVVVYIPNLSPNLTTLPPLMLTSALDRSVLFIDLSPVVTAHYSNPNSPLLRFEKDSHPNRLAHALIAREIRQALQ